MGRFTPNQEFIGDGGELSLLEEIWVEENTGKTIPEGGGVTDHSVLTNLAFADSGHTGFQVALNGTGLVRMTGTSVSYDNATYLTSVTVHNLLSATHGDTLADSVVAGDILIGNATPKWARLAKGTDGKFLKLVSGLPSWESIPAGVSFGTTTQIPYMNVGGTDFLYSAGMKFDNNTLMPYNILLTPSALGAEKITNGILNNNATGWTLAADWSFAYQLTVSGITTSPGTNSTWTHNSVTYTIRYSVITGTAPTKSGFVVVTGASSPLSSGTLTKASGTGDATMSFSAKSGGVYHIVAGTTTMSQTSAGMITPLVVGEWYELSYDVVGKSTTSPTNTVTASIAGQTLGAVNNVSASIKQTFRALSTADLSFVCTSAARLGIINVSLKKIDAITQGSTLLLTGTTGSTPASGAGTRLMWIPEKSAFRAGTVDGTQWNDSYIGQGSFAGGTGTIASGNNAVALGSNCIGSGANVVSMGDSCNVSFDNSVGIGLNVIVANYYSSGIGTSIEIYSLNCAAIGIGIIISASSSGSAFVGSGIVQENSPESAYVGSGGDLTGNRPFGVGYGNIINGDYAGAIGDNLQPGAAHNICVGSTFSDTTANSFNVGFGARQLQVTASTVNVTTLPSGTLVTPPGGLAIGDIWEDVTTSAQYPILRIRVS